MSAIKNNDCLEDETNKDTTSLFINSSSYYSTNDTQSNLIGTGRVLGNAYSYAGRRLERAISIIAPKFGLTPRPDILYWKIQELCSMDAGWMNDEKNSKLFILHTPINKNFIIHSSSRTTCIEALLHIV